MIMRGLENVSSRVGANFTKNQILQGEQDQQAAMGEICSIYAIVDKCVQYFSWKPERECRGESGETDKRSLV